MSTPDPLAERYRHRGPYGGRTSYRCPACLQKWYWFDSLKRHMGILHHKCRFCPKAYIRIERHEKYAHTNEYAVAAGACER
jgi:hypothetical protein